MLFDLCRIVSLRNEKCLDVLQLKRLCFPFTSSKYKAKSQPVQYTTSVSLQQDFWLVRLTGENEYIVLTYKQPFQNYYYTDLLLLFPIGYRSYIIDKISIAVLKLLMCLLYWCFISFDRCPFLHIKYWTLFLKLYLYHLRLLTNNW